jgi:hypothetical protein
MDNLPIGSLGTELSGSESWTSNDYSFSAEAGNLVWLQIMKPGYVEFGQSITVPASDGTISPLLTAELNS